MSRFIALKPLWSEYFRVISVMNIFARLMEFRDICFSSRITFQRNWSSIKLTGT